jgi:hypothetical protein
MSWRMASAPLMRTAKARKASAIWSCTIRDPAQLLASMISPAWRGIGQSLVPPFSKDGAGVVYGVAVEDDAHGAGGLDVGGVESRYGAGCVG